MSYSVLGGGISGLATAFYLTKNPRVQNVTLLEASNRLGGWIESTRHKDGAIFEHGPRTLRVNGSHGANTLALVEELGLSDQVIALKRHHPATRKRLLFVNGNLHLLPHSLGSLFRPLKPFKRPLIFALLNDLYTPGKKCCDDNVYNFISRRFGEDVAKYLVDPMIRGICAGDAKAISAKAFVFGSLFRLEQQYGGVVRGLLKWNSGVSEDSVECNLTRKAKAEKWMVWSVAGGLQTIVDALEKHLRKEGVHIMTGTSMHHLDVKTTGVHIRTSDGGVIQSDHVFAALPAYATSAALHESPHGDLKQLLSSIKYVTVGVVNIEYDHKVEIPKVGEAFGCLVPSVEKDVAVLGIVFDTCIFPQGKERTIFTVMIDGGGGRWRLSSDLELLAIDNIRKILGVTSVPVRVCGRILKNCIAQYTTGHNERLQQMRDYLRVHSLPLSLIGTAYDGVGVNDAIMSARKHVGFFYSKLYSS